jgi:hypothetical protein
MADSRSTKITEHVQANQTGHFAIINAWACNGKRYTKERMSEIRPKINVRRNGQMVLPHS